MRRDGLTRAILSVAMAAAVAVGPVVVVPSVALAEHYDGKSSWSVSFGNDEVLRDNFSDKEWADDISKLQPGDDITFSVKLKHAHDTDCDWYMSNEVLKTLEERDRNGDAEGGAYAYKLTYYDNDGKATVLYDNGKVGGDASEGLAEATNALDDYLYLDTLSKGQTGRMEVNVALDGETEGNAYFETIAQLKMRFAVELTPEGTAASGSPSGGSTVRRTRTNVENIRQIVRTGDETRLFPFFVAMVVSGLLLMVLVADSVRRLLRERKEAER